MGLLKQPLARYFALLSTVLLIIVHYVTMQGEHDAAQLYFVRASAAETEKVGKRVQATFQAIHQSASTMARVPGIAALNGEMAKSDQRTRTNAQQIFDSLARQVDVSHIHVAVLGFDHQTVKSSSSSQRTRPLTVSGPNHREVNESNIFVNAVFREIKSHQQWFLDTHPVASEDTAARVPMIGGVTSRTQHEISNNRTQSTKVVLSVPVFASTGTLAGTVSVVISSSALSSLLPNKNFALVNTRYNYVSPTREGGQAHLSARWVELGAPDPELAASSIFDLETLDPRSQWRLWYGRPNKDYYNSPAYETTTLFETGGYIGFILLLTIIMFVQWLETARAKAQRATEFAEKTRAAHAKTLKAEREARRLNEELKANMKMLSDTQLELVKHERLAALGQVTATLSHEIRNPLGAIRSSLYVIRLAAEKAEIKLDRPLDRIERSVTRCDNLIGDFLEYTRTHELSFKPVNATEFLNLLLDEQTFAENITIKRDLPDEDLQIVVDPDRFRRVIINLVENAAQAITEHKDCGGEICVSCRSSDTGSVISVSDNGPGIPDDVLGKIFEPLFTTKSFGAGLGLATVKQLIEQHGAELTIDTTPDLGTTFNINLKSTAVTTANNNAPIIKEKAA